MARHWLLSNSCYGTRLHGDQRGFVSRVWDRGTGDRQPAGRVVHNLPGTRHDAGLPELEQAARAQMAGPALYLTLKHAEVVLKQFQETARERKWDLLAVAVMIDHFHVVIGAPDDVRPAAILGGIKAWGTKALNERFGVPASETWWTERGSKRSLYNARAVGGDVRFEATTVAAVGLAGRAGLRCR